MKHGGPYASFLGIRVEGEGSGQEQEHGEVPFVFSELFL
jgi:hypothetical protein